MIARQLVVPARALSNGARPMLARSQPMQRVAVQQRQLPQINLCTFTVFCVVVAFSFPIEW